MLIFLVGFMGSGKTHWGKLWAEAHQFPFVDLDAEIELNEGKTVAAIFEKSGEFYFRDVEAKVLRSFEQQQHTIIACGGGTPCFHGNMQWMNEHGTTVYLSSPPADILERVLTEQHKRPLLKNLNQAEMLFFIEQKLKEREPFYTQAKITLPAAELDQSSFEQKILTQISPS